MVRWFTACFAAILMLGSLLAAAPANAAQRTRCFEQTGKCVSGAILDYWEKNGGLSVFGYPITDLKTEWNMDGWNGPTQWFERDRLEDHANEGKGVLAGRLGAQYLETSNRPWQSLPKGDATKVPTGCRFFVETGHSLCGKFLEYWSKNGGLERFGYPVSETFSEELATWGGTVQYFERRRMELHPENAGTPYEVLLGLLGRDLNVLYNGGCADVVASLQKTAQAFGAGFSCAIPFPRINIALATQSFERGQMVWVPGPNGTADGATIYVVTFDPSRNRLVWQTFYDSWREGDAVSGGEAAPAGLLEPIRGFGKVWRENPSVRNALGWATANEAGQRGHFQYFSSGNQMIYRSDNDRVYLIYNDGTVDDVSRIK